MATWRRKKYLDDGCPGCGQPFKPGEKIVVLRAARTVEVFRGSSDTTFVLDSVAPLLIAHPDCVAVS